MLRGSILTELADPTGWWQWQSSP